MDWKLTITEPSNHNVGSGPIRNISRSMIEPIKVLIPDSLGKVTTSAKENSIIAQNNQETCGLNSKEVKSYKVEVYYILIWKFLSPGKVLSKG